MDPYPGGSRGRLSSTLRPIIDPMETLQADRVLARSRQDPCADLCTLATVDTAGQPQARMLVLRDVEETLAVFVNATSPKWETLHDDPVSVLVWLPTVKVQYRLTCTTSSIPDQIVRSSWQLRPDPPKRMDWYYTLHQPQSSEVKSRDDLIAHLGALDLSEPLDAPDTARGLFLHTETVDRLDLGMSDGVHDRRRFKKKSANDSGGWIETVLTP